MKKRQRTEYGSRRSVSRLVAVQALYQLELAGGEPNLAILQAQELNCRFKDQLAELSFILPDNDLVNRLVFGVVDKGAEIDDLVDRALLETRTVNGLEVVLRIALRAGTYVLLYHSDIDPPVVIDEYVEITKAFFGNKEPALVNGVLDRLAKMLASDKV